MLKGEIVLGFRELCWLEHVKISWKRRLDDLKIINLKVTYINVLQEKYNFFILCPPVPDKNMTHWIIIDYLKNLSPMNRDWKLKLKAISFLSVLN